jgi:protein SOK2
MSALDSSGPQNPTAANGNLPAIQYLPHPPPGDMVSYHPQQAPMGHIPPPSSHGMQPQNAYLPQPSAYMPPQPHYSAQPTPYDQYPPPPPPHQSPYAVSHFTHSPHPQPPYGGHHFQSEYHHDPFQYSGGGFRNYVSDPSGQSGPPGMKPRVTTTLWEDEGTLCFQVEAKGICVARREGMSSLC